MPNWYQKLIGSLSGNVAEVDANNQVLVRGAVDPNKAGLNGLSGIIDDGAVIGTPRGKRVWVTEGNGLVIAPRAIFWDDTFNATAQNTGKYRMAATTQTFAQAGGYAVLNNTGITTINTNSALQSYRTFPLLGSQELRVTFSSRFASATQHVANNVCEMGLFTATLPGGAIPTDGVFFRYNASNELRGVVNYNGVEVQTAAITPPSLNVNHDYMIIVQNDVVTFWIDKQLRGVITIVTDAPSQGQPFMQATVPVTFRQYIGGSAPATATKLEVSDIYISVLGLDSGRDWPTAKAGMGHMGSQGQNGGTMGSTAGYTNNANPTAAVPTNTTAALGTGLGGQFWETFSLAVTVDGIIQSFQNPVGAVGQTPRNLLINGLTIDSFVSTVLVGGPSIAEWVLNYGHTAVSLATAEAAAAKAPRRIPVGVQAVTAAQAVSTLTSPGRLTAAFRNPIVVAPGEFVALSKKYVGTVGTSGVLSHLISYDAVWE